MFLIKVIKLPPSTPISGKYLILWTTKVSHVMKYLFDQVSSIRAHRDVLFNQFICCTCIPNHILIVNDIYSRTVTITISVP